MREDPRRRGREVVARRAEARSTASKSIATSRTAIGVDIGQIAATIRPLLAGQTATRWEDPTGEERDVVVQVPSRSSARRSRTSRSIPVATSPRRRMGGARRCRCRDVARIEAGTAPAQIDRKDLERVATIGASTAPELSISEASAAITATLEAIKLPAGYTDHARRRDGAARGDGGLRGRGDPARDHPDLPDPRVAVRVVHAAVRDHAVAAAVAGRRAARAAGHRRHAEHDVDDRRHHAHGARDEERDPAGGQRERAPRRGRRPLRRRSSRRARCVCARS